jgi:hypothetical protein
MLSREARDRARPRARQYRETRPSRHGDDDDYDDYYSENRRDDDNGRTVPAAVPLRRPSPVASRYSPYDDHRGRRESPSCSCLVSGEDISHCWGRCSQCCNGTCACCVSIVLVVLFIVAVGIVSGLVMRFFS